MKNFQRVSFFLILLTILLNLLPTTMNLKQIMKQMLPAWIVPPYSVRTSQEEKLIELITESFDPKTDLLVIPRDYKLVGELKRIIDAHDILNRIIILPIKNPAIIRTS